MQELRQWIPLLLPFVLLELALKAVALRDLVRREGVKGPKWAWALIIVFVNFFGSIVYLAFGRGE